MDILASMQMLGHEQVLISHDPSCGYFGIIAIHDTTLGPALGGTRFWQYGSTDEAITDALRLARGMTYKSAVMGINLGGGKSVIVGDPRRANREEIFRAHGRFVETLKGRYITAEDVNTSPDDMEYCAMETQHVTGLPGTSGDPSPVTAYGVYQGIKAAAKHRYGSDDLGGRSVTVQGVGHVGYYLCQYLSADGARLIVTDIDPGKIAKVVHDFGATAVGPDEIYAVQADILAGAANNVLAEERHGDELHRRGILYAPDYVINAGGLINVCGELNGWAPERSMRKAGDIYNTLLRLFELSAAEGLPTYEAADRLAEDRIAAVGKIQSTWV
jgi:leucine dehydrogenase